MKKTVFMDKYPVYSIELMKNELKISTTKEIVEFFKAKIEAHPIAKFIAIFDHYSHTKALDGQMVEGLLDAQNIVFCFGQAIPNTKMLAVRPRSIGVCEFADKFVVDFMEPPKEELYGVMQGWVKDLLK